MEFLKFCDCVRENVCRQIAENYGDVEVELKEKLAVNGERRMTMTIKSDHRAVIPVYYLDEFYKAYQEGDTMEDISMYIANRYEMDKDGYSGMEVQELGCFDDIKYKITMKVVNAKCNRELLRSCPHYLMADLAVMYQMVLSDNGKMKSSVKITNEMLNVWGVTRENVHQAALEAVEKDSPYVLNDIGELQNQLMMESLGIQDNYVEKNFLGKDRYTGESWMMVLTNKTRSDGASVLANPSVMKKVMEIVNDDIYVLPSSVHEVIILPQAIADMDGLTPKGLGEMVRDVNAEAVDRKDWLSDHVYGMSLADMRLKIVKESMEKSKEWER